MKTIKELLGLPEAKKMKGEDPCWKGYEMIGTKKKNGKEVPNCVPKNEEVEIYEAKVGDTVSFHHELKAAPGTKVKKSGTVEKVENDTVHVKVKDRYGVKRHQVKMSDLVKEEVELEEAVKVGDTITSGGKNITAGVVKKIEDGHAIVHHAKTNTLHKVPLEHIGRENIVREEAELDEARSALTYTPEVTQYAVIPDSRMKFVKFFKTKADAEFYSKKHGGKVKPVDQAGRTMKEDVELEEMWRVEKSEATGRHHIVKGYNDKRKVWKNKTGAGDFNSESDAKKKAEELNSVKEDVEGVVEGSDDPNPSAGPGSIAHSTPVRRNGKDVGELFQTKSGSWGFFINTSAKTKEGFGSKEKALRAMKQHLGQGVAEGSTGWHPSSTLKNPNFNDELSGRRVSPPGKRLKSGGLDYNERTSQERVKALIKYTKNKGGLTGPKGPLPEEVEQVDELNKDTVYSYNKKSTAETDKLHKKLGELIRSNKPAEANKTAHKLNKRVAGQERADARLNNEEKDLDQLFTEAMKKKEGEETSTKKVIKKGQELSGKQEPVKINPEIQRNQIGR